MAWSVIHLEEALCLTAVDPAVKVFLDATKRPLDPTSIAVDGAGLDALTTRLDIMRAESLLEHYRERASEHDLDACRTLLDAIPPALPEIRDRAANRLATALAAVTPAIEADIRDRVAQAITAPGAHAAQALSTEKRVAAVQALVRDAPLGDLAKTGIHFESTRLEKIRRQLGAKLLRWMGLDASPHERGEPDAGWMALCNAGLRELLRSAPDADLVAALTPVLVSAHPAQVAILFPSIARAMPVPAGAQSLVDTARTSRDRFGGGHLALDPKGIASHVLEVTVHRTSSVRTQSATVTVTDPVLGMLQVRGWELGLRHRVLTTGHGEIRVEVGRDAAVDLDISGILAGTTTSGWYPTLCGTRGRIEIEVGVREIVIEMARGLDNSAPQLPPPPPVSP